MRFGFSQLDSFQGNPGVPFAGMFPGFSLVGVLTEKVEVLLALVYRSPSLLRVRPSFETSIEMVGPTPVFLGLDGPEKEVFLVHVSSVWRRVRSPRKMNRSARFWWEQIGIAGACPMT